MPARIIALEGIDQSGKKTQARLLAVHLKRMGLSVGSVSFPIYSSPAGRQIRTFLAGKRRYPPEALHMLYSLNRWENKDLIHRLANANDFVIANRYMPSNLAYGVSRGLSLSWLRTLDEGLPTADLVVVLDMPVPSSFERKNLDRDVHESNRLLLSRVRKTYKRLANTMGWRVVDATFPVTEVESSVRMTVEKNFDLGPDPT